MNELHGWKAVVMFSVIILATGTLAALGVVSGEMFLAVLYIILGYAAGNGVMKKHNAHYEELKRKEQEQEK